MQYDTLLRILIVRYVCIPSEKCLKKSLLLLRYDISFCLHPSFLVIGTLNEREEEEYKEPIHYYLLTVGAKEWRTLSAEREMRKRAATTNTQRNGKRNVFRRCSSIRQRKRARPCASGAMLDWLGCNESWVFPSSFFLLLLLSPFPCQNLFFSPDDWNHSFALS